MFIPIYYVKLKFTKIIYSVMENIDDLVTIRPRNIRSLDEVEIVLKQIDSYPQEKKWELYYGKTFN